jgi:peptide deformylase
MAIRIVREKGDPVLLDKARQINRFDHTLARLIEDMFETMEYYNGVGLAAPQVGISKRLIVVDTGHEGERYAMVNPEIVEAEGEETDVEGCLSVPGVYGEVDRYERVLVRYQDASGEFLEVRASDLLARALQHEIDHLNGVLFVERVTRFIPQEEMESDE